MDNNIMNLFTVNYKRIITDEIALQGLEGIGIEYLWRRVGTRLCTTLTEKMKRRYWDFIVNNSNFSLYKWPEPFPHIEIIDRFTIIDELSGHLKEPDNPLDGPYEYKTIENERGSCRHYDSRKPISSSTCVSYEYTMAKYKDTLVIVASMEERWQALAPHLPITYLNHMMPINFCLLELIGRSRENGQMSVGNTNLHKIIKDAKTLFYNRKNLKDMGLIDLHTITQVIKGKSFKCLLIRLKKFDKPDMLTIPKVGPFHNVMSYLLKAPNYCERTDVLVKKGLLTSRQNKRLQKTVNVFSFEDRVINPDNASTSNSKNKQKGDQKRKFIFLTSKSDDSSDSEDEVSEPILGSEYQVGVSLMRRAYELFLNAGLQGLTQVQLSNLLGIEFYTARAICRLFRARKIVREYLEDNGKQRTARFIAVVATEKMDKRYEAEKKIFLELRKDDIDKTQEPESRKQKQTEVSDNEIPLKRIKLENDSETTPAPATVNMETAQENLITEIKVLDGCDKIKSLKVKKNPTLRQLKFANGILKVLKEKLCITGYMTLSTLASREVNEPPMDTKALKMFMQKLLNEGHIKLFQIKWPGIQRYSVLICARHVKPSDPIVKAKYKEICVRAALNKNFNVKNEDSYIVNGRPAKVIQTYPRYTKIQKLHEFVIKLAYYDYIKSDSHTLPQGFMCVIDLFLESTVEFLIYNLCASMALEISQLVDESQLKLKLREAPPKIYEALTKSKVMQNSIRLNLKVLAMLGLIQLVSIESTLSNNSGLSNSSFIFYVNRQAKILNTTGIWPRKREDVKELTFTFNTLQDVTEYWTKVFSISVGTHVTITKRGRKQLQPPIRLSKDVKKYDTGERFGDGNGPCGFDSCFFMEIPRLWQTFYCRSINIITRDKQAKATKIEIPKKPRGKAAKRSKKRVNETPSVPLKRIRPPSSVKWSPHDDLMLTLCKTAITIMSPTSQPGSLIIRNVVAKDILAINDPRKTKGLCHTRFSTIASDITLVYEKQCLLTEMKRRPQLLQKYEGLLKKIRLKHTTNMTKFINRSRIPMMELIWTLIQVMNSSTYKQTMPCVALNLEEFYAHFTITTTADNKVFNIYKVSENSPLKEAIITTVIQTLNSDIDTEISKKIYATFKQYPESALRIAVDQLRKCGAIAAKEKLFNNQSRKLHLEDITQTSYKMSMFYQNRWISRLNTEFSDKIAELLSADDFDLDVKGSAEINCVSLELRACDFLDIVSSTVPVVADANGVPISQRVTSALIIDTKYNLKTGAMKWKKISNVKISDLYDITDLESDLNQFSRSGRVKISQMKPLHVNLYANDKIILHLKEKGENGATFPELQNQFKMNSDILLEKLVKLESDNVIRRVGFYENVIVLIEHFKAWTTKFDDSYLLCTPWLKLKSGVKIDILMKWVGAVTNIIFEKPGCSVTYLADKCEFLTYRAVQDIVMFLEKNECITLNTILHQPADLFSEDNIEPPLLKFNPFYAPECLIAFPTKTCLTKYSLLRKCILDKYAPTNCFIDEV